MSGGWSECYGIDPTFTQMPDDGDRVKQVYAVVMTGVYDQGIVGIFSDRGEAEAHATALYADSDKHHSFEVRDFVVDKPEDIGGRWLYRRHAT